MWTQVIEGLGSGLVIALLGYAKSAKAEDFDWQKFGLTTLVGAIIGAIAGFMGTTYDATMQMTLFAGITTVVDNVIKAVYRLFAQPKTAKK